MARVHNKHHNTAPKDAVYIGRGSPWGNLFIIGKPHPHTGKPMTRDDVCDLFESKILPTLDLAPLQGKDLVCFCKPKRCHGDSLLLKANGESMHIQIRGTSGSGKSTIIRHIIDWIDPSNLKPHYRDRSIPYYYSWGKIRIVGPYVRPSGGLDVLGKEERRLANLFELYKQFHDEGCIVLSEGIMQAEDVKWTTQLLDYGVPLRIIYMDTDLDTCIERIIQRRLEAGNTKDFSEDNTRNRHEVIRRSRLRLLQYRRENECDLKMFLLNGQSSVEWIKSQIGG